MRKAKTFLKTATVFLSLLAATGGLQPAGARCCVEFGDGCDFCPFNICLCASRWGDPVPISQ